MDKGKKHIMAIEFSEIWGDTADSNIALFDKRDLTENEALAIIKAGVYDSRLLIASKTQFNNVFRSLWENKAKDVER